MIEPGCIRLVHGPKENRTRPAVDPLFRSAAIAYGPRVVGVVLTGYFDDGTAGLLAIKDRGGIAMIQDPTEAFARSMPENAAASVAIDHCCRLAELATLLIHYDPPPLDVAPPASPLMEAEHKLTAMELFLADEKELTMLGSPSG
jgi:two-component system chemotaxis response regulator CheB